MRDPRAGEDEEEVEMGQNQSLLPRRNEDITKQERVRGCEPHAHRCTCVRTHTHAHVDTTVGVTVGKGQGQS